MLLPSKLFKLLFFSDDHVEIRHRLLSQLKQQEQEDKKEANNPRSNSNGSEQFGEQANFCSNLSSSGGKKIDE